MILYNPFNLMTMFSIQIYIYAYAPYADKNAVIGILYECMYSSVLVAHV